MTRTRRVGVAILIAVVFGAGLWWLGSTNDARLFALDGQTGAVRWSAELPYGTRLVGNPVVQNGRVVASTAGPDPLGGTTDRWSLRTYDTRSGRQIWEHAPPPRDQRDIDAPNLALTRPFLTDERVYVRIEGNGGAALLALDAVTGERRWSVDGMAFGHYSRHTDLAASGGRVFVPTRDGDELIVQARREEDGADLWRATLGVTDFPDNDLGPFLAASPETVFVGLFNGYVALDAATGAERYRVTLDPTESGGQIELADRTLYRRSGLHAVDAYDAVTGQPRWTYRSPFGDGSGVFRSFAVGDGLLAVSCACDTERERRSGWLLGVDAASGQERWRAPLDAYLDLYQDMPVIGAGVALTGSEGGDDVVARSMVDGGERWRFSRERGQLLSTDGRLVYVTDRAPRWQHWLKLIGGR